jgi:hypothetical protein
MLKADEREMKTVLLVGTSHEYQLAKTPSVRGADAFGRFVEQICASSTVAAIGEEMNPEALRQLKATQSICKKIADTARIPHIYCDPDNKIRRNLNIKGEQDIKEEAFFQNWDEMKTETEIRRSHSVREAYWLEQITNFNIWPILFICGSNHVDPFSDMLWKNGLPVEIVAKDWEPPK